MCGIAGVAFRADRVGLDAKALVARMTDAVAHRGPDGRGLAQVAGGEGGDGPVVVLGHRRLAIIDLSERASQPMRTPGGDVSLIFNGEIYNYRELRRTLESKGRRFASDSDTEVLLQAYEQWGSSVVERLEGMFAFAVWDRRAASLLLGRDRLGIKPLYTFELPEGIVFASEVRALLASGLVPRALDTHALDLYLAHQTVPTPRTLVRGVRMLEPGHVASWTPRRQLAQQRYWDVLDSASRGQARTDAAEAQSQVRRLLTDAVGSHLVSDVPVGLFLSGGIDSSALVALVRAAGVTPRTFCVTSPGTSVDEAPYARAVAEAFEARHEELTITDEELQREIPGALDATDHPSGDGVNTYVVSHAVRRAGIKVALSGLGGDEFFGGYPSFHRQQTLAWLAPFYRSPRVVRRLAAAATRAVGPASVAVAKTAALLESDGSFAETFPVLRQMFTVDERRRLLRGTASGEQDPYVALLQDVAKRAAGADEMALVSYAEARTYMHDVLLRDTDQMSMRHGLEVRVPLLDHRLVEYLVALPAALKRTAGGPKPLLVDSLGVTLPEVTRRPKQGFVLPFDSWMRTGLRDLCEHYLGAQGLKQLGVLHAPGIDAVWQSFLARDGRSTWSRPWTLIALGAWIERNGIHA